MPVLPPKTNFNRLDKIRCIAQSVPSTLTGNEAMPAATYKTQKNDPVAVIDIGSNAVRLVIYDGLLRCPLRTHTERLVCGLGRSMMQTGCLDPDGAAQAMDALARFAGILDALKIKTVLPLATAALRDAQDGPKFIAAVKDKYNIDIQVISGTEEARLSALGVIAGFGDISGIVGDFGGGSLELIAVDGRKITDQETLPVGALRIMALGSPQDREDYILDHLSKIGLLKTHRQQNFYVLGGAWRTLARAHIHINGYPVPVIDHYTVRLAPALEFTELLARQSPASLERMAGLSARRARDIPSAALVMHHILKALKPKNILFSGTGLREGVIFDRLSAAEQKRHPLLTACSDIGEKTNRLGCIKPFHHMAEWLRPLFAESKIAEMDIILESACLLSDIGWYEHEDHRAANAYRRMMCMPLYGLSHRKRAILALALFVRYQGYLRRAPRNEVTEDEITAPAQTILTRAEVDSAVQLGLAIRMAHLLTGSVLPLLHDAELRLTDKVLRLVLRGKAVALSGHVIQEALADLAKFHKCRPMITRVQ